MQEGFVLGDYERQFYPWTFVYAKALQGGGIPLWIEGIQCGFPLFAEGQVGMLYAINLILFSILKFNVAYNLLFLIHFLFAGLFSYIFAKSKGMSSAASAMVSICFTFGSSYAGCFYSIVTMRTLVWLPLALYLVDYFLEKRSRKALIVLSFLTAQSWLGGFPQTAFYASFFVTCFSALTIWEKKSKWISCLGPLLLAQIVGLIIASPQIWASGMMASQSARTLQDPGFVFWGSVPPWNLVLAPFFYEWGRFQNIVFRLFKGVKHLLFRNK